MPKMEMKSNSKPSTFAYPAALEEKKNREVEKVETAVLSITAKAKAKEKQREKRKASTSTPNLAGDLDKAESMEVDEEKKDPSKENEVKPEPVKEKDAKAVKDKVMIRINIGSHNSFIC